jgi:nicotinate-nucleotide adenylyltransferase
MRRIGIYSGTFDPVHNGHIGFAVRALEEADLNEVIFIPERIPREKAGVTDLQHRFELLVRAVSPYNGLTVRLLPQDQFCVDGTLPSLRTMYGDARLCLLLGSDVVRTFPDRWDNLDRLFADMDLVIGVRTGDDQRGLERLLGSLDVVTRPQVAFVNSPIADATSTRVRQGDAVYDVAPEVFSYIRAHKLYRKG